MRYFLKFFFGLLFWLLTRVKLIGLDNVPKRGGAILATNHLSIIDAPLVFYSIPRMDLTALVAKTHLKNPFLRWVVNGADGIWINREEVDVQAVKAARLYLRNGGILGIAPEGTRSKTGALNFGKTGVAYLADKAGVPIIPAAISGTYGAFRKLLKFRRVPLTIEFGTPFMLPAVSKKDRDSDLQRNTDEIMCRIGAMLPPELRGVYADHPRLLELLQEREASARQER